MAEVPKLLRLDAGDNVAVAARDLKAGDVVMLDGLALTLERDTPTGHKVAVRSIAPGEKIVKYRTPIGSATAAIAPGAYVHTHNLASDYIATYTLDPVDASEARI